MTTIESRTLLSTTFAISPASNVSVGRYMIEPLPSDRLAEGRYPNRFLLRFPDEFAEADVAINPAVEARLLISFFALATGCRIRVDGDSPASTTPDGKPAPDPYLAPIGATLSGPELEGYFGSLAHLDEKAGSQFIRAATVFRAALDQVGPNNTLAFFLLTISIECVANVAEEGEGTCEKFVAFILKHASNKASLPTEEDWRDALKEIYYRHRSGFTHGGKPIPDAVYIADLLDRPYVRNEIEGKLVKTPGLKWFASVTRDALLGYLRGGPNRRDEVADHFRAIARESGKVKLVAASGIAAGQLVSAKDLKLD